MSVNFIISYRRGVCNRIAVLPTARLIYALMESPDSPASFRTYPTAPKTLNTGHSLNYPKTKKTFACRDLANVFFHFIHQNINNSSHTIQLKFSANATNHLLYLTHQRCARGPSAAAAMDGEKRNTPRPAQLQRYENSPAKPSVFTSFSTHLEVISYKV